MSAFEKELKKRLDRANAAVVREAEKHFATAGWPLALDALQERALARVLPRGFSFEVLIRLKKRGCGVKWIKGRGLMIQPKPKMALRKSKT